MKQNGNINGHQGFWNPVKIFIRLVLGRWMKEDKITGERFLVDTEDVKWELDDIADEPYDDSLDDN